MKRLLEKLIGDKDPALVARRTRCLAVVSTVLAFLVCAGSFTYAWLSENRTVDSDNFEMSMQTTSNLVISDSTSEIVKANISEINSGSPFAISATADNTKFAVSSHDITTTTSNLVYVVNTADVNLNTGLENTDKTLVYDEALNTEDGKQYYKDVTVYVASYDKEMTDAALSVEISSALKESTAITSGSLMATSVDFYLESVSDENFKGTLNVAGKDTADTDKTSNSTDPTKTKTSLTLLSAATIPQNTSGYVTVVMRCYFDGALLESAGQAYVNSATLDLSKVTVNFRFTGTDAEA